jgi:hypothetical protein
VNVCIVVVAVKRSKCNIKWIAFTFFYRYHDDMTISCWLLCTWPASPVRKPLGSHMGQLLVIIISSLWPLVLLSPLIEGNHRATSSVLATHGGHDIDARALTKLSITVCHHLFYTKLVIYELVRKYQWLTDGQSKFQSL